MKLKSSYFVIILAALAMISCKEALNTVENHSEFAQTNDIISESQALNDFTVILSKAVYENEELRAILKTEALNQFDNDYDVFYPYIKDANVDGNNTFRDILLNYSSEEDLQKIEAALPLLNILIPDLSWVSENSFNVNNWDTVDSHVSVLNSADNKLFADGQYVMEVTDDMVPSFPVLVVKNNERLKVTSMTKGGEIIYDFIADAYDKNKNTVTKVTEQEFDTPLSYEQCDHFYPASEINDMVIQGWNEFKDHPIASERDYIYYGQTKSNTTGVLNTRVRDRILRFRIDPQAYTHIADGGSGDPVFNDTYEYKSTSEEGLSDSELKSMIWKDGNLEIEFEIIRGSKTGSASVSKLAFSVPPADLFQVTAVKTVFYHKTFFRPNRIWKYQFGLIKENGKITNLESKWYYPNERTFLVPWDLYNMSDNFVVFAREVDDKVTKEYKTNLSFSYAESVGYNAGLNLYEKLSLGINGSNKSEWAKTEQVTINKYQDSDELESVSIRYMDPIITGKRITDDGELEYELFSSSSGMIEICVIPEIY